jgi:hypothetical protein
MKVCHTITQRSTNEAMDRMDEACHGFKDDRMINDHETIDYETTQISLVIMSQQSLDDAK